MRKTLAIMLSVIMLLSTLLAVPFSAIAEKTVYYYSDIDFTESGYANGGNVNNSGDVVLTSNADETFGAAMKFATVRTYSQRKSTRTLRLVDKSGTAPFVLQPSTKYRVTYNIKAVTAPSNFTVGLYFVTTNNPTPGGTEPSYTHQYVTANMGSGYTSNTFEFTAPADDGRERKVLLGVYCSSSNVASSDVGNCELYIDNIVIAAQTSITYSGTASLNLPSTAWANQTWEELLGADAGRCYLDAQYTKPAKGVINSVKATIYAAADYYSDIDLTESGYANGGNVNNSSDVVLTPNADDTFGAAMKFATVRVFSQRRSARTLRLVDNYGTAAFVLQPSTKYRVTYNVKAVTAPSSITVGLYFVTTNNPTPGGTEPTYTHQYATANMGSGYNTNTFEFTSPAKENTKVLLGIFCSNKDVSASDVENCEIYIDNIVIAEETVFTYENADGIDGLPSTAWANQTYEEVFDSIAGVNAMVYTDAAKQQRATGVINKNTVTLYPKVTEANIIDFEEPVYEGNPSAAVANIQKAAGVDANGGAAGKITGLCHLSDSGIASFKLANLGGNGYLKLQKGYMYAISYDIKTVRADVDFTVGISTTSNSGSAAYSLSNRDVQTVNKHNKSSASATWQSIPVTGQFTAQNSGEALLIIYHNSSDTVKADGQEIYIDNIQITKLATHDLVLHFNNGDADSTVPVAQYSDFSELPTPKKEDFIFTGWFLNSALTSKAEGLVGTAAEVWAGWVEMATYTTVTFDEPGVTFAASQNDTWQMTVTSTGEVTDVSGRSVEIATTTDANGKQTKAAHFNRAREHERPHPANVRVYSTVPVIDDAFLMKTYTAYDITFSYRVDSTPSTTLNFNVVGVFPLGGAGNPMNSKYERSRILAYSFESVSEKTNGWKTVTYTYYTAGNRVIPHIALVSSTTKEASNVDVWVDNITVAERTDVRKISFNTNGGNAIPDTKVIIGTVPPAFPVPVKENKTFTGWFTNAECQVPFTENIMPDRDILLYAGWTDKATTPSEFETGFGTNDFTYSNTGSTQITDNYNSVGVTHNNTATDTYVNDGRIIFNDLTGAATESSSRHIAAALVDKNGKNLNIIAGARYKLTMVVNFNGGAKAWSYVNLVLSDSTPNGGINSQNSTSIFSVVSNDNRWPLLNEWYTFEHYFIAPASGKAYLTHYASMAQQNTSVDYFKLELVDEGEASLVEYYNEEGKLLNQFYGKVGSVLVDDSALSKQGYYFNGWRIGSAIGEQWLSNEFPAQDTKLYASWIAEEPLPENPTTDFTDPVTVTFDETNAVKAFYGDSVAFGGGAGGSLYGMYAVANDPEGARNGSGYFRLHYSGHAVKLYYRKMVFFHEDSPGNRIWLEPNSAYKVSYWYKPDEVGDSNLFTVGYNREYEYGYQVFAENQLQDAAIINQFGKWNYYETTIITESLPTYLGMVVGGRLVSASIDDVTVMKLENIFVTYETNGGSNVPITSQLSYNYLNVPAEPEREGYNFVGWYSDSALTKPFDFANTLVTESITLYAKWEAKKYKTVITYEEKEVEVDVTPEDAHLDETVSINDNDEIGNIHIAGSGSGVAWWLWLVIAAGAVVLLGGAALVIILIAKKRKEGER